MGWRVPLPEDPVQRTLVIAIVCSLLLHVLVLGPLLLWGDLFTTPLSSKRGEPLLVDITPERPEDKAPVGNPSRPVGPDTEGQETPPKASLPPATKPPASQPKVVEIPKPPARKPAPRAPAPPKEVAKAEPPVPEPLTKTPPPEPAAPAPNATETPKASPAPAAQPAAPSPPLVATARPPASIWRQPGGGGGLQGGGRGGVEGEPIPLDTKEPKFQDYFNKIRERIKANWIYPREAGERGIQGELIIEFHIAKDGRLQYLELRRSSGEEILDQFAINAVKLAQPFPPVPDDIAKDALAINGVFRYQIVSGFTNQFLR